MKNPRSKQFKNNASECEPNRALRSAWLSPADVPRPWPRKVEGKFRVI